MNQDEFCLRFMGLRYHKNRILTPVFGYCKCNANRTLLYKRVQQFVKNRLQNWGFDVDANREILAAQGLGGRRFETYHYRQKEKPRNRKGYGALPYISTVSRLFSSISTSDCRLQNYTRVQSKIQKLHTTLHTKNRVIPASSGLQNSCLSACRTQILSL